MKKLLDFANYLVGGMALIGLAAGITYGMYSSGGIVLAVITGLISLATICMIALGMSGKFNEEGEKGFSINFAMPALIGAVLLIIIISCGAAMSSLHKTQPTRGTTIVAPTATPSPHTSSPTSVNASSSQQPVITPSLDTSFTTVANDAGLPPIVIAILVGLGILIILVFIGLILKSGGNADIFGH